MNEQIENHTDPHAIHETYSVEPGSFDFAEKQDVILTHKTTYGSTHPSVLSLEALPPLFYAFCGISLFMLGSSFTEFDMFGFGLDKGPGGPTMAVVVPVPEVDPPAVQGKKLFNGNCVACHQASGLGQAGNVPPLAGSDWVNGNPNRLVCILTHGLQGSVHVNGAVFNAQMPAYPAIPDDKLSYLLTYIRSNWGNKGAAVDEGTVTKVRASAPAPAAGAYSEQELLKIQ